MVLMTRPENLPDCNVVVRKELLLNKGIELSEVQAGLPRFEDYYTKIDLMLSNPLAPLL